MLCKLEKTDTLLFQMGTLPTMGYVGRFQVSFAEASGVELVKLRFRAGGSVLL